VDADGSTNLWASFTHALRTPSDAERDFYLSSQIGAAPNGTPLFARFNANPNFVPEQLNASEAGYRKLIGKNLYVDVTGFFNHYHDLFSEQVIPGFTLQNTLPYPAPVPPPTYLLLSAQFQNGLYGGHLRRRNCTGMAAVEILEAARVVFVPADVA
jgi:iron complex outermembrane receptor protein